MATVTRFPTTDQAVNGVWTTPSNVQADDNLLAVTTIAAKNTILDRQQGGYGFDALIPPDSVINSVTLEVQNKVSTQLGIAFLEHFARVDVTNGSVVIDGTEPLVLTTLTTANYARPGGGVWARADLLDAVFATRIRARTGNDATSVDFSWDYIKVTVDFTPPLRGGGGGPRYARHYTPGYDAPKRKQIRRPQIERLLTRIAEDDSAEAAKRELEAAARRARDAVKMIADLNAAMRDVERAIGARANELDITRRWADAMVKRVENERLILLLLLEAD